MRTILTNKGKARLLSVWREGVLYMGFGSGVSSWFTNQNITEALDEDGLLSLGFTNVTNVVVKSEDEESTFVRDTDYSLNAQTGVVTRMSGGAIGDGDTLKVAFTVGAPNPSVGTTALIAPIGYKKITAKSYAELADDGLIDVETGRFNLVVNPTPHLYIACTLNADEFVGESIREIGFFFGLTRNNGVADKTLLVPSEVANAGELSGLKYREPHVRDGVTEFAYSRVISL